MPLDVWRLRLLEVFERVGTVRGVAAELHLSPSAVSQQLALLEREAGTSLFERTGRTLRLTPTGSTLSARAREVGDRLDAIEGELRELTTERTVRLRLAGFASSVEPILLETVRRLQSTTPRLHLELLEIEPRDSAAALRSGRCEIVVTVDEQDGALFDPTIEVSALTSDPMFVVLPAGHRLAGEASVALAELASESWVLDVAGSYLGELVPRACRESGFEPVVAARFSSHPLLLAHVAAQSSVGVLPGLAAPPTPGVVRSAVSGLADRQIVAAVRRASLQRPMVVQVLDVLRAVTARPG